MISFHKPFTRHLIVFLALISLCHGLNIPNMDVVMRGGDSFSEMDWSDFPKYRNGTCTIRFPRDGNWATQNGFFTGGWDANQNSACQSNDPTQKMTYTLQRDGNFVARCQYHVDYATHTAQSGVAEYFLGIDDSCILHLYKGTLNCDSIDIQEELWTNIRTEPLQRGDRLGKGEMIRHDGTTLILQSSDGNLVVYGSSLYDNALWGANQEWNAPPTRNLTDYFARITNHGWLLLVGIDRQYGNEYVYFRKNLGSNGATCFTVEYDAHVDDLVAVACGSVRRSRQLHLRGGDEE